MATKAEGMLGAVDWSLLEELWIEELVKDFVLGVIR